jgi:cytochrome c peroxidase
MGKGSARLGAIMGLAASVGLLPLDPVPRGPSGLQLTSVKASYEMGREVFLERTFDGNGRTCATCHEPRDEFTVSPDTVRQRFATNPDGPLFRAVDSDDGEGQGYSRLLDHAVFRVTIPLASNVTLLDEPMRRTITVWRGVPSLDNVSLTAPYDQDGRAATLQDQAAGAIRDHFEPGRQPLGVELDSLALFLDEVFYPSRLRSLLDVSDPVPKEPGFSIPVTSPAAARGKVVFDRDCRSCHGGETGDRPSSGQTPRFATVFVSEDNEPGFPLLHLEFRNPNGTVTVVTTPDPGRAAVTGDVLQLNAFEIPQLRGVRHTAPYFHDNSAATLFDVVDQYNVHFPFRITRDERDDLVAYLETL